MIAFQGHQGSQGFPDPLGSCFDLVVAYMGVAHGHAHTAVAEQAGDNGQGHAVQHGLAGYGVPEVMKAHVFDPGLPVNPIPEPKA